MPKHAKANAAPAASHPDYAQAVARLSARRRFGIRPGLETIQGLLAELDHPERAFRSIHVTGSKGKGSVTAIAASVLSATGAKVGRFTSPHLLSYRERMEVDGTPISQAAVVEGLARAEAATSAALRRGTIEREPTFFEMTTALAFDWFRTEKVDAAVVEVGLGGRLDSTNVLDAPVGVITTIELEHVEILGPTLAHIAREKAGILHPGMTAVVGETKPTPLLAIDQIAHPLGVSVWHLPGEIAVGDRTIGEWGQEFDLATPHHAYEKLRLPLHGIVQAGNAALAIAAVERFQTAGGRALPESKVRSGLQSVRWRGRLEKFGTRPEGWLDVAHTPESARALAQSLAEINPLADPNGNAVIFGCLAEKRADEILEALSPLATTVVVVPVRSARALDTGSMRRSAEGRFPKIVVAPDIATAWRLARAAADPDGFVLVTGSDYLVGDLIGEVEGRPEAEPDLSDPGVAHPSEGSAR